MITILYARKLRFNTDEYLTQNYMASTINTEH